MANKQTPHHGPQPQHGQHAPQHAPKSPQSHARPDHGEPAAKTHEKVLEMGRGNMENLMHTAETCTRTAGKLTGMCSENMNALAESGSRASRVAQDVASEIMQGSNRVFADYAEISKRALACRTLNDMVELQNQAVRHLSEDCFAIINNLSGIVLDGYSEAMEPFYERTATASDQFRKAVAA